jgi:hypothetical protein
MIGLISLGLPAIATAAVTQTHLHPPQTDASLITAQDGPIVLSSTTTEGGILVLDYGANVEGIPSFEVIHATGDTRVFEITYSESKAGLDLYMVCRLPSCRLTTCVP